MSASLKLFRLCGIVAALALVTVFGPTPVLAQAGARPADTTQSETTLDTATRSGPAGSAGAPDLPAKEIARILLMALGGLLGAAFVWCVWLFVRLVGDGVPVSIESHWGGIGGGIGGWSLSPSMAYLAASLLFASVSAGAFIVAIGEPPVRDERKTVPRPSSSTAQDSALRSAAAQPPQPPPNAGR